MVMELLMAVLSFIVSVMAGLAAGWIVYFIMLGGLRMPEKTTTDTTIIKAENESLLDRFGVMCFRVANRIFISSLGGALVALVLGKPKARRA